jgi:hydrogenase/urease accessory protein HupE
MLVVGTAVAVAAAKRGQVPELPPLLEFLAVPLGNLAIFAVLVAVGLYKRRKRDSHKRLMMLAKFVALAAIAVASLVLILGIMRFS